MRIAETSDQLNTEPSMITRAQNGDANAFATLFEAHKSRIYAVCLRMTNNTAEAEDLTQDAFIHVFRKLSTFRGDSAFSTWLYRIAVNTVLMHFRRKGGRQIPLEQSTQEADQPKREYGHDDEELVGCIDRLALARAIQELPDGYRVIFLLHEVKGYEHKEIARILQCSVGNSKSQLHKAKLRLRKLLVPRRHSRPHRDSLAAEAQSLTGRKKRAEAAAPYRKKPGSLAASSNERALAWGQDERRGKRKRKSDSILSELLEIPLTRLQQREAMLRAS